LRNLGITKLGAQSQDCKLRSTISRLQTQEHNLKIVNLGAQP